MTAIVTTGDARALPFPDNSIDLVVTSPPYWKLRRYAPGSGNDVPIGEEPTSSAYLASLLACTAEAVRVLTPGGSAFVNLGDTYNPGKGLRLLPERYRIACADDLGLTVRAVIVWSKAGKFGDKARGRVRRTHEDWIHLTLGPDNHDGTDAIREQPATHYHDRPQYRRAVELFEQNDFGDEHLAAVRAVGVADTPGAAVRSGGRFGSRNGRLAAEVRAALGSYYRELCGSNTKPRGSVPGSVWAVPTYPLKVPTHVGSGHYAAFPVAWPQRLIAGWCPPGGTVLDPFGGTGTTALVADVLGMTGISLDASDEYARIASWRTQDEKQRRLVAALADGAQR